jgi:hypothetical protein
MKNTAQYKFTAKKIIAKLTERLEKEESPLYADWIISLMREGFKKQDAVDAFRKSKFILLADGSITTKPQGQGLRRRLGLITEELVETSDREAVTNLRGTVDYFQKQTDAQQQMIHNYQSELHELKRRNDELSYKVHTAVLQLDSQSELIEEE